MLLKGEASPLLSAAFQIADGVKRTLPSLSMFAPSSSAASQSLLVPMLRVGRSKSSARERKERNSERICSGGP